MVRGLVFDLDGVLVHTDELHYRAWKALAGSARPPLHSGTGDRCRGVSRMGSLEILLEGSNRSYTGGRSCGWRRKRMTATGPSSRS